MPNHCFSRETVVRYLNSLVTLDLISRQYVKYSWSTRDWWISLVHDFQHEIATNEDWTCPWVRIWDSENVAEDGGPALVALINDAVPVGF